MLPHPYLSWSHEHLINLPFIPLAGYLWLDPVKKISWESLFYLGIEFHGTFQRRLVIPYLDGPGLPNLIQIGSDQHLDG